MLVATSRRRSPSITISLPVERRSMTWRSRRPPPRGGPWSFCQGRCWPSSGSSGRWCRRSRGCRSGRWPRASAGVCRRRRFSPSTLLTLALLVLRRLGADHPDHSVALDHPAAGTHLPNRRTYLHLQISRIRPRDRSLDASSTPTLSPARSRVKWVLRRSATWARTNAPFSSSTRYTPLGRGSLTTPFTSGGRGGTNGDCTKLLEVSLREHDGPLFCDSDGVLKVGGQGAVRGADRPAVRLHEDLVAAGVDHGFDRQGHPRLEPRRGARRPKVRDLRVLVHLAADAMPDELPDDREAGRLDVLLDRGRDVAQVAAWPGLVDADVQGLLGHLQQAGRAGSDLADADGDADVRPEPLQDQAQVEADQVALGDLAVPRDAMDGLVVDRDADRAREAVVAQEARGGAPLSDQAVGDAIELDRLDPRLACVLQRGQHRRKQAARAGHEVDLVGCLEVDHAVVFLIGTFPFTAASTWRLMSSIVPRPSISETSPPPR